MQHERTGLVIPAGDPRALAAALRRRLGDAGRTAAAAYTPAAWADGMAHALTRGQERGC